MSGSTTDDLSGRSSAELTALAFRIQSLLKGRSGPDREDAETEVVEAFLDLLGAKGNVSPIGVLRHRYFWPQLKRGAKATAKYLRLHAPVTARRKITRKRAYIIMARVLIRWLEQVGAPTSPRTIANNLDKIPALMDQQFPGYVESGLLEWVFTMRR